MAGRPTKRCPDDVVSNRPTAMTLHVQRNSSTLNALQGLPVLSERPLSGASYPTKFRQSRTSV
eukprot:8819736-Pyramimonas_sp.AAC.1